MITNEALMDVTEASAPLIPTASREDSVEISPSITQNLVITRQEVFALTSDLGRLPQAMICEPGPGSSGNITISIVDDPPQSPTRSMSQQTRNQGAILELENLNTYSSCEETQTTKGKCQMPKYSVKTHMLRKHSVLQFFATGPMDQTKTPYKW